MMTRPQAESSSGLLACEACRGVHSSNQLYKNTNFVLHSPTIGLYNPINTKIKWIDDKGKRENKINSGNFYCKRNFQPAIGNGLVDNGRPGYFTDY